MIGLCVDDTRIDLSAETSNSGIRKSTANEIFLGQPEVPSTLLPTNEGNIFEAIGDVGESWLGSVN